MNILVLNASPKAKTSITLQNVLYLEKKFPMHSFSYIHIGCSKTSNEKNLEKTALDIRNSDLILFSFPVYTFIAPSQLHYFIRLLKEHNLSFLSKNATCITTSKHFYDTTAHKYLEENLLDLGFNYIEGLSLDMEDLLTEEGQKSLVSFFERTLWAIENNIVEKSHKEDCAISPTPVNNPTVNGSTEKTSNVNSSVSEELPTMSKNIAKKDDFTISIVVDYSYNKEHLKEMVDDFVEFFPYKTKIVDLSNFSFKGGCLGCLKCALEGKCVYNDNFNHLLEDEILSSDGVIYAFSIIDHSMGPLYKTYDDRRFYNGHRTVSQFKPIGYIIDGNLAKEDNLRTIIVARSDVGRNYLTGLATKDLELKNLAFNMSYALEHKYTKPRTFYGVGGMKIFRDLIWIMRGIMRDDHKFYKKYGFYDFPQKQRGKMLSLCLVGSLMRNKKLMQKGGAMMDEGMLAPYKKVIEKASQH